MRCFSDHLHSTEVSDCAPPCPNPGLGASTVKRETARVRWYSAEFRGRGFHGVGGGGGLEPAVG